MIIVELLKKLIIFVQLFKKLPIFVQLWQIGGTDLLLRLPRVPSLLNGELYATATPLGPNTHRSKINTYEIQKHAKGRNHWPSKTSYIKNFVICKDSVATNTIFVSE